MTLTLATLRCPDAASPERREIQGGEFTIGRAADNDWVLFDPDRHLSKRHCVLAFRDGDWRLTDLSTNGTFLNREIASVGQGRVRDLRDGDRLRLGAYEIEIRISAALRFDTSAGEFGSLDPLLPEAGDTFEDPVQPDHSPAIEDAFRPPQQFLLDDDWDLEVAPPSSPTAPMPPPPVAPALLHDAKLLAAFLRGAGVAGSPADPEATMEAMGAALRATVSGLREALIARAALKSEFRIEPTLIRARGNNPLKFSAGDDDALAALLGVGRHIEMAPAEAIGDALRDMRLHELATVAAMQSAVRALLSQLSPETLRESAGSGGLLPAQRKVRAWEAFEAQHARLTRALSDDFDSVFGRAFARAYERALDEADSGTPPEA